MDFGKLLYTAHKNDKSTNKDVKCYKTKFEPPKKEIKTKANLSANIQKYLQKRDEEDRKKADEEKRKKEELLALRSQDRKSFKRVQTMLKRTKSANKSVMEDAIDDVNTAVTMAGPQQCDEDDYGYVSQEASTFYDKLMNKYSSMPAEEPKFPQGKKPVVKDLKAAKDRVRAALQREEEEEMMPHKRKRKSKVDNNSEENGRDQDKNKIRSRESSPVEEPKPKKPKKIAPPPLDFSHLLKIAEQKQFEPIKIEKKVKEEDSERPMTKKQKIEYERERERMERKLERENSMKSGQKKSETLNRIPKIAESRERNGSLSGIGRIPKKSSTIESVEKSNNFSKKLSGKNLIESDRGPNNSDNTHSKYIKKHNYSNSDSESEHRKPNAPHKSQISSSIKAKKINSLFEGSDEDNISDREPKYIKKRKNSNSDSESEHRKSYATHKRPISSSINAKKINSLFEGSDEDNISDHGRHKINREVENKKPKNFHLSERERGSSGESKFKIPKANSNSELGRTKQPEYPAKPKSLENTRLNTSSSKSDVCREENKYLSNHNKSSLKSVSDRNRSTVMGKEKPPSSNEVLKPDKQIENSKKSSAEEMLKKSANVWSKPCNLPQTKPNPSGLSESQLERLRQMNKKPTPLKPIDNRQKLESEFRASHNGRSMQRDERNLDGRSMSQKPSQGRPSLLQAAAAAAAARAKTQTTSKSQDRGSEPKAERLAASKSLENCSSSKQPMGRSEPRAERLADSRSLEKNSSSSKQSTGRSELRAERLADSRSLENSSYSKQSTGTLIKSKEGIKDKRPSEHSSSKTKPKQFPPNDLRPKQFPPRDLKPKQFPPSDLKTRSFPPKDVRGREFPPPDVKRRPNKPSRIEDSSEDEYDSEMDDFIDDGTDMDHEEISQQIRSIFGYDKNKYLGLNGDDDDECEESNFDQIDQEEYRSLKIGAQEDLRELMKEKAERDRKKQRKLEMMKRGR